MMSNAALCWGVCAFFFFCIALIPCLGWLNWLNIPFSIAGAVFSVVAMSRTKDGKTPGKALTGLLLSTIAALIGLVRLVLGGGVL